MTMAGQRSDLPGDNDGLVTEMSPGECWELLARSGFGRVALPGNEGEIDVFPINFAVDRGGIVFRTAEGTKLLEAALFDRITLQADHRDTGSGVAWSVVVKGIPQVLDTFAEIDAAEELDIRTWVPTPKNRFVRITQCRISGRRLYAPKER